MTRRQLALYWREFAAVKRALMPGRETFTKHAENELRHRLHGDALGEDKSSADFTNADLDKVLGAFRAISQPGNLQAQLDALDGAKKRLRFGIMSTARKLVGEDEAEAYVAGIVRHMHADQADAAKKRARHAQPLKSASFEELDAADLEKVRVALAKQEARGMTVAAPKGTELARNYEDREVESHPF